MLSLHDAECRESVLARVDALTPSSTRHWGKMTVDQMLWHLNANMSIALGKMNGSPVKIPIPVVLLRPMALYLPFPRGRAQAIPETLPAGTQDLGVERDRFRLLVAELAARPLPGSWARHPVLGGLTGPQWSRLMAKHADYHLVQFGV